MPNTIPARSLAWVLWFATSVGRKCIFINRAIFLLARSAMTYTFIVRVLNNANDILMAHFQKATNTMECAPFKWLVADKTR